MRAIGAGQQRATLLLIELGADTSRVDGEGNNLLMIAAAAQVREMLLLLLKLRDKLGLDVAEKNKAEQSLADLVGGADIVRRLVNAAELVKVDAIDRRKDDDDHDDDDNDDDDNEK